MTTVTHLHCVEIGQAELIAEVSWQVGMETIISPQLHWLGIDSDYVPLELWPDAVRKKVLRQGTSQVEDEEIAGLIYRQADEIVRGEQAELDIEDWLLHKSDDD